MSRLGAMLLVLTFIAGTGCSSKLETGYEPAKLGSLTPAQRRGLYAQDFTAEARAAQADQSSSGSSYNTKSAGQP